MRTFPKPWAWTFPDCDFTTLPADKIGPHVFSYAAANFFLSPCKISNLRMSTSNDICFSSMPCKKLNLRNPVLFYWFKYFVACGKFFC